MLGLSKSKQNEAVDTPTDSPLNNAMVVAGFEDALEKGVGEIKEQLERQQPTPFGALPQPKLPSLSISKTTTTTPSESADKQLKIIQAFLDADEAGIAKRKEQIAKLQSEIAILQDKVKRGKAYLNATKKGTTSNDKPPSTPRKRPPAKKDKQL